MKALNFEEVKVIKDNLVRSNLEITILLDHFRSEDNIAHVFRMADALGVKKILLWENSPHLNWKSIEKKSRSCTKHIQHMISDNLKDLLVNNSSNLLALEWTDMSISINDYILKDKEITLILGNESNGIDNQLLDLCIESIHIPMYGINSSMNVAMAGAIAVNSLINKSV